MRLTQTCCGQRGRGRQRWFTVFIWGVFVAWGTMVQADPYPWRWVYFQGNLSAEHKVKEVIDLVRRAGRAGYTGIVLADSKLGAIERLDRTAQGSRYRANIRRVIRACKDSGIEIIPYLYVGPQGTPLLSYNPNWAAGYEVRNSEYEVRGRVAVLIPDAGARILDGGFEHQTLNRFTDWDFQDSAGQTTRSDSTVKRFGQRSARLDPSKAGKHGHCRVHQRVKLQPRRYYRLSVWVKTEALNPPQSFKMQIHAERPSGGNRPLTYKRFDIAATQDWTRVSVVFNSLDYVDAIAYFGLWGARSGHAWLDGAELTEIGPINVLRREGCPVTIQSADGAVTYRERYDYEPVIDRLLGAAPSGTHFDWDHEPPRIRMRPDFPDGTRLAVSYYHALAAVPRRMDCCLTEPGVDAAIERCFLKLDQLFDRPNRYLLGYDEMSTGGGCARCKNGGKTPGQLLADNVRRVKGIVRRQRSDIDLIVWHDMFDPNSNARDEYYLVDGSLSGSWEGLDRDMVVCCWLFKRRDTSMRFFADRGMRVLGSADHDNVVSVEPFGQAWLRSLDAIPRSMGIMYTTWDSDYDKLEAFGDIVVKHDFPTVRTGQDGD